MAFFSFRKRTNGGKKESDDFVTSTEKIQEKHVSSSLPASQVVHHHHHHHHNNNVSVSSKFQYIGSVFPRQQITTTPPGFNKSLRDAIRVLLVVYSFLMLKGGCSDIALVCSIISTCIIYHGKVESIKNILWGSVCWASLPISVWAFSMETFADNIDSDRSYTLYMVVKLMGRVAELMFGSFCAVVLCLTFIGKLENREARE